MGRVISLFSKTPEPAPEPGSTIPRKIRMGSQTAEPHRPAPAVDTRAVDRFVPRKATTFLTLVGGRKVDARIINMSSKAVAIEADFSTLKPDSVVAIGSHPVKPGRKIALGTVFVFLKPIDRSLCDENFVIDV